MKALFYLMGISFLISIYSCSSQAEEFLNAGDDKFAVGDYEGAIADYTRAINIDPNYPKAYARGATRLLLNKKFSGCLDLSKAEGLGHFEAYELIGEYCN